MRTLILFAAAVALPLGACATTSFAPPEVNVQREDLGRHAVGDCVPSGAGALIPRTVPGAQKLIDNFVDAYRCARSSAADGRQWFEVPSFLALTGAAAAVAFGAGKDVAIAGGAANSVLTGGKAYYVPQEKADIIDHALDAVLCIKTESVGVDAYNIGTAGQRQLGTREARSRSGGVITVPVDEQYYIAVEAALLSVERILGNQLSKAGKFDPAGIAAQIKQLAEEEREARDAAGGTEGFRARPGSDQYAQLQLDVLKVELDKCLLRAKMS